MRQSLDLDQEAEQLLDETELPAEGTEQPTEQPVDGTEQPDESGIDQTLVDAGLSLARGIAPVHGVLAFSQGTADHCVTPTHEIPPTKAPVNVLPSTGEGTNGSTPPPTALLMLLGGAMLLGGGAYLLLRNGRQPDGQPTEHR